MYNKLAIIKMRRFENIDILRGMVMILMCIDHARDYTGLFPQDPIILSESPMWLYILRILAHFCAPAFIFLAGISIGISGVKKDKTKLSKFLLSRGLVLVLLELTLVNWGWSFNPLYGVTYLQVIWAIGISMMIMSTLIHMRRWMILSIASLILLSHNLFSSVSFTEGTSSHYIWSILLQKNLLEITDGILVRTTYPILPVLAVMMLGYWVSDWYTNLESKIRRNRLLVMGSSMLAIFLFFRLAIGYGDPYPIEWDRWGLSVINLTKYPMSLNFVLFYLSISIIFLALSEKWKFRENSLLITLGRVPMFFYILHLYVLHAIVLLYLYFNGYTLDFGESLGAVPSGVGYPAWWLWWIIPFVVGVLIIPCRWYYKLKSHRRYSWTSYI